MRRRTQQAEHAAGHLSAGLGQVDVCGVRAAICQWWHSHSPLLVVLQLLALLLLLLVVGRGDGVGRVCAPLRLLLLLLLLCWRRLGGQVGDNKAEVLQRGVAHVRGSLAWPAAQVHRRGDRRRQQLRVSRWVEDWVLLLLLLLVLLLLVVLLPLLLVVLVLLLVLERRRRARATADRRAGAGACCLCLCCSMREQDVNGELQQGRHRGAVQHACRRQLARRALLQLLEQHVALR